MRFLLFNTGVLAWFRLGMGLGGFELTGFRLRTPCFGGPGVWFTGVLALNVGGSWSYVSNPWQRPTRRRIGVEGFALTSRHLSSLSQNHPRRPRTI